MCSISPKYMYLSTILHYVILQRTTLCVAVDMAACHNGGNVASARLALGNFTVLPSSPIKLLCALEVSLIVLFHTSFLHHTMFHMLIVCRRENNSKYHYHRKFTKVELFGFLN
jgi:hypothetical protein